MNKYCFLFWTYCLLFYCLFFILFCLLRWLQPSSHLSSAWSVWTVDWQKKSPKHNTARDGTGVILLGLGWNRSVFVGAGWDRSGKPLLCHPLCCMSGRKLSILFFPWNHSLEGWIQIFVDVFTSLWSEVPTDWQTGAKIQTVALTDVE